MFVFLLIYSKSFKILEDTFTFQESTSTISIKCDQKTFDSAKISEINPKRNAKNAEISGNILILPSNAFQNFTELKEVSILSNIQEISEYCFDGCVSLTTIKLPSSLITLGNYCFRNTSIREMNLSIGILPQGVFAHSSIEKIKLDKTTKISTESFYYCVNLASIDVPESVVYVQARSFYNCNKLRMIRLMSITAISNETFYNCTSLEIITLSNRITKIGEHSFSFTSIQQIELPETLLSIGDSAFEGCSKLSKVTLPTSLLTLGNSCFKHTNIDNIEIPMQLTSLPKQIFFGCNNLQQVTITSTMQSIGEKAFASCSNLSTLIMIQNVLEISSTIFVDSPLLKTIYYCGDSDISITNDSREVNESSIINDNVTIYVSQLYNHETCLGHQVIHDEKGVCPYTPNDQEGNHSLAISDKNIIIIAVTVGVGSIIIIAVIVVLIVLNRRDKQRKLEIYSSPLLLVTV